MTALMQSGVGWYGRRRSYRRRTLTSKPAAQTKPATAKQETTR